MVAMPPKLDEYAIANIRHNEKFRISFLSLPSPITFITDTAMGNIIMVVAVLLSHIEIRPVARIKPRMILFPLVPVILTIFKAIRLCKLHFSIARPIIKPPMKRKITSLP